MKQFRICGFSKYNVWSMIEVKTITKCISQKAVENGIVEITCVEEI